MTTHLLDTLRQLVVLCIFAHPCLVRLKPAMVTSTSASAVSQFGLIGGESYEVFKVTVSLWGDFCV